MFLSSCLTCVTEFQVQKCRNSLMNLNSICFGKLKVFPCSKSIWIGKLQQIYSVNIYQWQSEISLKMNKVYSRTLCQNFRTIGIKVPEKSKILDPPFLLAHVVAGEQI
eukprot:sb/3477566/